MREAVVNVVLNEGMVKDWVKKAVKCNIFEGVKTHMCMRNGFAQLRDNVKRAARVLAGVKDALQI